MRLLRWWRTIRVPVCGQYLFHCWHFTGRRAAVGGSCRRETGEVEECCRCTVTRIEPPHYSHTDDW